MVMYGCECWTMKKTECQRIDAFELWCWRRLLRVLGLQGNPTSPSWRKSALNIHWKDWCWSWSSNILATCYEEPIHWKRPWSGKDWKQEKGVTEDEMVGWHHQVNGHELGQTSGVRYGQWGLACCGLWGCKESDTTERLKWTQLNTLADLNRHFSKEEKQSSPLETN